MPSPHISADTLRQHTGKAALTTLALAILTVLAAACSPGSPPAPPTISSDAMLETLERVLEMGPQLQQQLDDIEKLSPGLSSKCAPSYPERCIPLPPPDLDCEDLAQRNFLVLPPDPHHLDPDKDGIGCEG